MSSSARRRFQAECGPIYIRLTVSGARSTAERWESSHDKLGVLLPALITFFTCLRICLPWPCLRIARPPVRCRSDLGTRNRRKQKKTRRTWSLTRQTKMAASSTTISRRSRYAFLLSSYFAPVAPTPRNSPFPFLLPQAFPPLSRQAKHALPHD
jgi:hypothetical protein